MQALKIIIVCVAILLISGVHSNAEDSVKTKWSVEAGYSHIGFSIRGQYAILEEHRILFGLVYAEPYAADFFPIRVGYQYAPVIPGKKHRWIYIFEASFSRGSGTSYSRLLSTGSKYVVSDWFWQSTQVYALIGIGFEFNLLKIFKVNAYPLLGYTLARTNHSFSNTKMNPYTSNSSDIRLGGAIGLTYRLPPFK